MLPSVFVGIYGLFIANFETVASLLPQMNIFVHHLVEFFDVFNHSAKNKRRRRI